MSDGEMPSEAAAPPDAEEDQQEVSAEEYDMLDAKLDDLNAVLDLMEQKNDRIHAEFAKLLESNKEIREELKKQVENSEPPSENNG